MKYFYWGSLGMLDTNLAQTVKIKHIDGPVGVHARNFSNDKIYSIGWQSKFNLEEGIKRTYPWIEKQVNNKTE